MAIDSVIGWDVGGAHLKAARFDASGEVRDVIQLPCPLWQGMQHLEEGISRVLASLGDPTHHAVTMTGEMVDLFPDRRAGVARLIEALTARLGGANVAFYGGATGFLGASAAIEQAPAVASANWWASAEVVAATRGGALFLDIGSTTTDLIPVQGSRVAARGHDDASRLVAGELLYTGVVRTPLMALAERAPLGGEWVPLMAEYFATTADIYRLLERLPEGADQHPAADGGEKSLEGSSRRLARMFGRDLDSVSPAAWRGLAEWLAGVQLRRVEDAFARLVSREDPPEATPVVIAGVGRFLAREVAVRQRRAFLEFGSLMSRDAGRVGPISDCAPAAAVAWLALRSGVFSR